MIHPGYGPSIQWTYLTNSSNLSLSELLEMELKLLRFRPEETRNNFNTWLFSGAMFKSMYYIMNGVKALTLSTLPFLFLFQASTRWLSMPCNLFSVLGHPSVWFIGGARTVTKVTALVTDDWQNLLALQLQPTPARRELSCKSAVVASIVCVIITVNWTQVVLRHWWFLVGEENESKRKENKVSIKSQRFSHIWTYVFRLDGPLVTHILGSFVRRPTVAIKSQKHKIKSRSAKWKVKLKNQKSIYELRSRFKKSIFNLKSRNVDFWSAKIGLRILTSHFRLSTLTTPPTPLP